jgi:hypothetical protein
MWMYLPPCPHCSLSSKIDKYRSQFDSTKIVLKNVQNKIRKVNVFLMKFKGLYYWRCTWSSQSLMLLSAFGSVALLVIPFRALFAVFVMAKFFAGHKRQAANHRHGADHDDDEDLLDRLVARVPLTVEQRILEDIQEI